MVDHISPERRSWLMSRVKGKHTSPEIRVRQVAHAQGLRFRLHRKDLPGKPDLVFPKYRIAMFVHGCFWHRHPNCTKASTPKTRTSYWRDKFALNQARDHRAEGELLRWGWKPVIIWECETRDKNKLAAMLRDIFKDQPIRKKEDI
jgi:DNA mismatch endonuclease (patch repair protein)